jgi:hypothetical protein
MRAISAILLLTAAGSACAAALPHFTQPNAIWNVDVSKAPLRSNSAAMMTHLEDIAAQRNGSGKWGGDINPLNPGANSNIDFQIDLSMYVVHGSSPTSAVVAWPDAQSYYADECDNPGPQTQFPYPAGGGIEGTYPPSYSCTTGDDCHLLVGDDAAKILYEAYSTYSATAAGVQATCAVKWHLDRVYPRYGRGEHCTSADGAGFPIAPLLFNADEVAAAVAANGTLGHAIRFILGNSRMMKGAHVHPSSHGTSSTSDLDPNAVPYGSRLRLKSSFDIAAFSNNEGVRALLRTLKKYGMFLSDGGTVPLTGESDYFNSTSWASLGIDTHSLFGINPTDFEVVESGDPLSNSGNCTLTPDDFVFIDGYDY